MELTSSGSYCHRTSAHSAFVCGRENRCTYLLMRGEARGQPPVSFLRSRPLGLLGQNLSHSAWNSPHRLGWLASEAQGSACLPSSQQWIPSSCQHALPFYMGVKDWTQALMLVWQAFYRLSYHTKFFNLDSLFFACLFSNKVLPSLDPIPVFSFLIPLSSWGYRHGSPCLAWAPGKELTTEKESDYMDFL